MTKVSGKPQGPEPKYDLSSRAADSRLRMKRAMTCSLCTGKKRSGAPPFAFSAKGGIARPKTTHSRQCHWERTRISCHAALDTTTRAPFRKERRMKFAKATRFHRKSGVAESLPCPPRLAVGAKPNGDLQFSHPLAEPKLKIATLPLCHPEPDSLQSPKLHRYCCGKHVALAVQPRLP